MAIGTEGTEDTGRLGAGTTGTAELAKGARDTGELVHFFTFFILDFY